MDSNLAFREVRAIDKNIGVSSETGNAEVVVHGYCAHTKASERYVDVTFVYADSQKWEGSIPIEYRRTGTDLREDAQITAYLLEIQPYCHPVAWPKWREEQELFWQEKSGAGVTKAFFDALINFHWTCHLRMSAQSELGAAFPGFERKRLYHCD